MSKNGSDRRERLVNAALTCFHESGYVRTSIAQVAERAGLVQGNVFYYFRTKDDLARAVVEEWRRLLAFYLGPLDAIGEPWQRLEAFLDQGLALKEMYVALGCPLAGLARDLRRESASLAAEAPRIYQVQADWVLRQFGLTGLSNSDAAAHTRTFMARFHGAIHLAYVQRDPTYLLDEVSELRKWLKSIRDNFTM